MGEAIARDRLRSGLPGLDSILGGGLPEGRVHLVAGAPGTGKTTLGFQFLLEGVRRGEPVLYVTLLQSRDEVEEVFRSHGWSLDGIDLVELSGLVREAEAPEQTVFTTAEIELSEVADAIVAAIERHRPARLVLDSVSEMSALVDGSYPLRRQLLRLIRTLTDAGSTSLFLAGDAPEADLALLRTISHGSIELRMVEPAYGRERRQLGIRKMRGTAYLGGLHDFRIQTGGIELYPRLQIGPGRRLTELPVVSSGNADLDQLLGGGLERGTSCLLSGGTGTGKSTLASLYVQAAARRGERAAVFCFEERADTFLRRAQGLGMELPDQVERGIVELCQYDVGDVSPGEFAQVAREAVDRRAVRVVVVDSLNGYRNAMPDERTLLAQLHDLVSYLAQAGVLLLLVETSHGVLQDASAGIDASYLADTVIAMRHFESRGEIRRCISVVKKRHGPHESTIREFRTGPAGIVLGPPLSRFRGVLTGVPVFEGVHDDLLEADGDG